MKTLKQFVINFPESYFLTVLLVAALKPSLASSPILLGIACIVIFQMLVMNGFLGMIMANVFLIVNSLLLVAMITKLTQFEVFDREAYQLFIGGSVIWSLNVFFSIQMIRKYMDSDRKAKIIE